MVDPIINKATGEALEQIATQYTPPSKEEGRWIFDYTTLYWEIKARLLGGWIIQDNNNQYQIMRPQGAVPLLNSSGIEETMSIINGFVSKIQALTLLDEERVLTLCRDLYVKLAMLYYIKMEDFELDPARASIVIRMIMNMFESNLRKSISGISLKMIGQTEKVVVTKEQHQKKFGII
jgi:hypothetical protein